ncbi:hypothetical protein GCM10023074_02350 [Microbispora amethystogenes]|uniref:DUF3073 domain-containing protein n=1 Tax=Microbispora amethystogenes TaxID=1427754 RepID=A0ABQ4F580_9ACTN|nr:DUF3073 family protein [Microbispora amethystogenes]GIH29961.1 hypothetical protein Mam01_01250 [Microbispora amethystogenes]
MGRGRAKAKQVKVARALKYSGGGDLESLRRELGVDAAPAVRTEPGDPVGEADLDHEGEPSV